MKLSCLFENATYICDKDTEITELACRPENSTPDSLLFLLNERALDQFDHLNSGAKIIVAEEKIIERIKLPKISVSNIRAAFSLAYKRFYCNDISEIKFVGITGTNGKSTTAIFLKKILEYSGMRVGLIGTGKIMINDRNVSKKNYSMTTPDPDILYPSIAKMKEENVDAIIMEVSSHALAQERVYPLTFDIGIFTNLSDEHLDYHKSISNYYDAKKKLFYKSKKSIVNTDDSYGRLLYSELTNRDSIGIFSTAEYMAKDICSRGFLGTLFTYKNEYESSRIKLNIPAVYNVYNALLAIRAAECLGVEPKIAKNALEEIKVLDGRFRILHTDPTVIIDYAHTSGALYNLLKNLNSNKKQGQFLWIVFGCGGNRDAGKRSVMGKWAEKFADKIILTSDNPRDEDPGKIIDDIMKGITRIPEIIPDRENAIRHAILCASKNDIVAIIGKGPEKYSIKNGQYTEFDEEKIVMDTLEERQHSE